MEINKETAENINMAARLFQEYGSTIRSIISFQVNDKSTVDDILHDFFLSLVYKPIPQTIEDIKNYLYKAVKNDVLNTVNRTKNYRDRNRKYAELHAKDEKNNLPENIASQAEQVRQILDIVESRLMSHEAKAVTYRYYYDYDAVDAAKAMQVNSRSFSHYLCTGLKKLRRSLCKTQIPA